MVRVAVVAVLSAIQLASPLLCCCSATRLAGPVTQTAKAPSESPDLCPCCRHPAAEGEESQATSDQPQKPQPPARPACPCRQHPARNAALAPDAEAGKQFQQRQPSQDLSGLSSFAPLGLALVPAGNGLAQSDAGTRPFLTAGEILRAFHIMRC
jgi:hypothetical protein